MEKCRHETEPSNNVNNDDDVCPICLCPPSVDLPFAWGPCHHAVCKPCMERVLLSKTISPLSIAAAMDNNPDAHLAAPTLGRCPICRSELSLFQLNHVTDDTVAYEKDHDMSSWPIAGSVYRERAGNATIHFPSHEQEELPYVSFENVHDTEESNLKLYFDKDCHYHAKSRTFHGTLVPNKSLGVNHSLLGPGVHEVIVQFSSDLRFISAGIQVTRLSDGTRNPLDGQWLVTWETGDRYHIQVVASAFQMGRFRYRLDLTQHPPRFQWPTLLRRVSQTAISGIDLEANPNGPAMGESIVWNTSEDQRITWTRESFRDPVTHVVEYFGSRGMWYERVRVGGMDSTLPRFIGNTLWGNCFCQGLKVGLASYQFLSEQDGAYISYEHPLCAQWPPLDDGSPIPSRVFFRNVSFDTSNHVFQGTIEWQAEYGTSWQGCKKWIYAMKFDSEYTCIISGSVKSVIDGDHEVDMSTFGADLVYINAAIKDKFEADEANGVTSAVADITLVNGADITLVNGDVDHSLRPIGTQPTTQYSQYARLSQSLRHRLISEGASVRIMAMVHHVLTATQQPGSNPIDFNI